MAETFGPYRLLRRIGLGGTAEVFLATRDPSDPPATQVVVKRLSREMESNNDIVDLFMAEGHLMVNVLCPHPNLITVTEVGRAADRVFMEMEYVQGPDLSQLIDRADPDGIPSNVAARIALDLCAALEHVHTRTDDGGAPARIVHGDVNPSNVLIDSVAGVAKLTDFGVAVRGNVEGTVRGTHAYMSPEQVRGEHMDARSDIHAIGIVLWELLSHKRLFRRSESYLTLAAVVEDQPPELDDIPQLNGTLQKALAKSPADRHASCAALATELERIAAELGWDVNADAVRTTAAAHA
jgi:serine/threonine-protein kinase